jgi:hypothetical protein
MGEPERDSKFYEKRYHLEERERRRRLICNGVFIGYTLVLIIGIAQALFVEAFIGTQVYAVLLPFAILSMISFVFWIGYHIYSRRIINQFYKER